MCGSDAMRSLGNKCLKYLSRKTNEKGQTEYENSDGSEFKILKFLMNDEVDVMSLRNDTSVRNHVFNVSEYHRVDLLAWIEQVKYPDI